MSHQKYGDGEKGDRMGRACSMCGMKNAKINYYKA
jgi:hypothetical protein